MNNNPNQYEHERNKYKKLSKIIELQKETNINLQKGTNMTYELRMGLQYSRGDL